MKLMEQVCQILRVKHYSLATERCYCQWIRRFIFFHGVKHLNTIGAATSGPSALFLFKSERP